MATAVKFRREMQRLEIEIPPGGNEFIGVRPKNTNGSKPEGPGLKVRVSEGHSFLSGQPDTVFFDGEMTLELQYFNRGYQEKPTPETFAELERAFHELYPNRFITPDFSKHSITLGLITDTETPVDVSSHRLLEALADRFGFDKEALLAQANWCLVTK